MENKQDIEKLNQEKKLLKLELDVLKKHASIVITEITIRNVLIKSFTLDAKDLENKIQELSEKIDYFFIEATKIKCVCSEDRVENCLTNCDYK